MHVTESIFLKRTGISESDAVYELWSRDFGRIRAFASEKRAGPKFDTGCLIQASVETKGGRNRLVSAKLRKNLNFEGLDYDGVLSFLKTVRSVAEALPEGVPAKTLFDEFVRSQPFFEDPGRCRKAGTFFRLKFAQTLGTYEIPKSASEAFRRLSRATGTYAMDDLVRIAGIEPLLLEEADSVAESAFRKYHL